MTLPKKRRFLGCLFPVLIIIAVIAFTIVVIGLLAGPIGQGVLKSFGITINFPSWLVVPKPAPSFPATVVFHLFTLPVTNTMIATWITVVFLVVFSWLVTRRIKLVPGRLQSILEFAFGWIYDLCISVAGEENGKKFFPIVCTIFLFVLFNAWMGLIPGYGSILIHRGGQETELIRAANTDINTPLALAIISLIFVTYHGLRVLGVGWLRQYFDFGGLFHSLSQIFHSKFSIMGIFSGVIQIFVGFIELLSMLIRVVSFTFRLWGNMTAGEILLLIIGFLIPFAAGWVFYGLELLIGTVQAIIFSLLTLVFASMATASHEEAHA